MMNKIPNIDIEYIGPEYPVLSCPKCGDGFLHHLCVTVYDRQEDDDTCKTIQCFVEDGFLHPKQTTTITETSNKNNPSSRRGGVCITFACDYCPGVFDMTIEQHKCMTYIRWRPSVVNASIIEDLWKKADAREAKAVEQFEAFFKKIGEKNV
jgi:hypothetical protein